MKINHVGSIVRDIEKAVTQYTDLGFTKESKKIKDDIQEVFIVFMKKDNYVIELIQPVDKTSKMNNLLKKQGAGVYHVCYELEADDISFEDKINELKDLSYLQITDINPAIAFDNRRIVFLYHQNLGFIELLECNK